MAAVVQLYQPQSSVVTMLQARTGSPSGSFQSSGQLQQGRSAQVPRSTYGGVNNNYRAPGGVVGIAPYAFTMTPPLVVNTPFLRQENRSVSAPMLPHMAQSTPLNQMTSQQVNSQARIGLGPNSKDDSATSNSKYSLPLQRPLSAIDLDVPISENVAPKPSPDRYRRNNRQAGTVQAGQGTSGVGSALPSGSGMASIGHLYSLPNQPASARSIPSSGVLTTENTDDPASGRQFTADQAKRYRKRSAGSLGKDDLSEQAVGEVPANAAVPQPKSYASAVTGTYSQKPESGRVLQAPPLRPSSSHGRSGSDDSLTSSASNSRPTSVSIVPVFDQSHVGPSVALTKIKSKRNMVAANPTAIQHGTAATRHEAKAVKIPPRNSSDANKRLTTPSPLSRPMAMSPTTPHPQQSALPLGQGRPTTSPIPSTRLPTSPAAQQLAAVTQKEAKKEGKSSRLRRAFSFGSAAELRKASAENSERARLQKGRFNDDPEAREAAIVQQQEAGGLGENIYSGQGHFFTGSTDNLSVSSTASSASVMLRKMGKGMKKSGRSFVGLFRPKSVIGVPAADAAAPEPSLAQVSMVTIEAEREKAKINVNSDPHDQPGGGTGFPKLERNSLDMSNPIAAEALRASTERSSNEARPRRSIMGGERERAEVLSAVKKGILKSNQCLL